MSTAPTTARPIPGTDIDPFALDSLRDPFAADGAVREIGPVVHIEKHDYYAVTRFKDIRKGLRDWRTFSSTDRPFYEDSPFRPRIVLFEEPPAHTRTKSAIMDVLGPRNLQWMGEYFKQQADALLDRMLDQDTVEGDGYADLAAAYVLKVFPDVIGMPEEGRELLLKFGSAGLNAFGPPSELRDRKLAAGAEAVAWVERNIDRDSLTEGGLGRQLYDMADEGRISEEEARDLVKTVFAAGFDTSTSGIASMLRAFGDHPEEWHKLRRDPALVAGAWEESVRLYPPNRFGGRWTPDGAVVDGHRIPAGAKVLMMWLGAARDPREFDRPDDFVIDREMRNGHLSFGFGLHTCAGNLVARLEATTLLRSMAERIEDVASAGEPRTAVNYQAFGHEYVPLRLRRARA
ncbi:Cytochrome p450 CYP199A2 [Streptomyces sp. enrichment culture]|uniref:cytochrome P450 n=1 Tax=Streptomyces sp. enrichment culture TaxID=1795815 RepID=UPI003F57992A